MEERARIRFREAFCILLSVVMLLHLHPPRTGNSNTHKRLCLLTSCVPNRQAGTGEPVVFSFGEGLSYTTFAVSAPEAPATVGPCAPLSISVQVKNTGTFDSDVVVQVFLAQAGTSRPSPATRLVTFARVSLKAGASKKVVLPPVLPVARAIIHPDGGNATNIFSVGGKRWAEAGKLALRVVTGEHNGDRVGGLAIDVEQTSTQDIDTC